MSSVILPSLAGLDWLQSRALQMLLALLETQGEARIVGGALRDSLSGKAVGDIDIATSLTPDQVTALAKGRGFAVYPTGIEHGTVTVMVDKMTFEVTTLRCDIASDGRHAVVAFTDDWVLDAKRRDFTMNALYCDRAGKIYDPLDGYADVLAGRVLFVGDAGLRIKEDYLRILRFFRFFAGYGHGAPDAAALSSCAALQAGLDGLSGERIGAEFKKLIMADGVMVALRAMAGVGILQRLVGKICDIDRLARLIKIEQVGQIKADVMLRLSALVGPHDTVAQILRLSRQEAARLASFNVDDALSPNLRPQQQKAVLYRKPEPVSAVMLAWSKAPDAIVDGAGWTALLALAQNWQRPSFPLSGADLIAAGYQPGPQLGAELQRLEDGWIAGDFSAERAQLLTQIKP